MRCNIWGFWEDNAWNEYLGWQAQDRKTLRKINKLIKDIQRNPFEGTGHPEPLSEIYLDGGAAILMRRTVLCTRHRAAVQPFFLAKDITVTKRQGVKTLSF